MAGTGTGTAGCGLAPGRSQGVEQAGACCQLAATAAEACVCSNYEGIMLNPQSLLHGHAGTLLLMLMTMTMAMLLPTRRG